MYITAHNRLRRHHSSKLDPHVRRPHTRTRSRRGNRRSGRRGCGKRFARRSFGAVMGSQRLALFLVLEAVALRDVESGHCVGEIACGND